MTPPGYNRAERKLIAPHEIPKVVEAVKRALDVNPLGCFPAMHKRALLTAFVHEHVGQSRQTIESALRVKGDIITALGSLMGHNAHMQGRWEAF